VVLAGYWNRFPCKFTVSPEGARFEATARQRNLNRIVTVIGALAGRPNLAGAGLLAQSQESPMMNWGDVQNISYYPRQHVISLKNSWRTVLRLHCNPENFEEVARICRNGFAASAAQRENQIAEGRRGRAAFMRCIGSGLPWAVLSIVGSLLIGFSPLLDEPRYVYALLGVSTAASLAGGGLRRLLGVVSLVILAALTLLMLTKGSEVHTDIFGLMKASGFDAATGGSGGMVLALAILGMVLVTVASLHNTIAAALTGQPDRRVAQTSTLIGIGLVLLVVVCGWLAYWRTQSLPAKPEIQTVEIRSHDPMLLREFKLRYNAMIENMRVYNGSSGNSRTTARMNFEKAQHNYNLALRRVHADGSEIEKHSADLINQAYRIWTRIHPESEGEP